MIRKKPTLNDIAREAGVSQSAVSLAFSGKGRISEEIRNRIFSIADKMGYKRIQPSGNIHSSELKNVAILLHLEYEYLWHFFHPTIVEIEKILYSSGYNPVILPISYKSESDHVYKKLMAIEAVAVFSLHYADLNLFTKLEGRDIPVVILHNCDYQDRFSSVSFDDLQGAYEATSYLIDFGHTNLAYVEYQHKDLFSIKNDRFFGFKRAIDEYNLSFYDDLKLSIDYNNLNETRIKLERLFKGNLKPTAIFVHDDYLALRVLDALSKMNLSVPKDVSIIAPGDVLVYSEPNVPQITTMSIDPVLIGKLASDLMLNRLKTGAERIQVLKVKELLIERGSVKNLKVK